MKTYLFIAGLLLTLLLSIGGLLQGCAKAAHADFTVGKVMTELITMYDGAGNPRTNCQNRLWSATTRVDGAPVSLAWTFRNPTTGTYRATATPSTASNDYEVYISYSGIPQGTWASKVGLYSIDTMYAAAGPRMSNISGAVERNRPTLSITTGIVSEIWNSPMAAKLIFGRYSSGTVLLPLIAAGKSYLVYKATEVPMTFALGSAYNLTGRKAILMIRKPGGSQDLVNAACTVTDAGTGACTYTLTSTQTNAAIGRYTAAVMVENMDGTHPMPAVLFSIQIANLF